MSIPSSKWKPMDQPIFAMIIVSLASGMACAGSAGWRNDGTSMYPDARPPIRWSSDQNVVWKTATPTWSNASPAIFGDRLFVLGETSTLLCLDRNTGRVRWQASNDCKQGLYTTATKQLKTDLQEQKPQLERDLTEIEEQIRTFDASDRRVRRKLSRMRRRVEPTHRGR